MGKWSSNDAPSRIIFNLFVTFSFFVIDGLILISTHQCEIDKYVNPLIIYENKNLPILHLIIDENVTIPILKTKIENYLTTIKDTNP